MQRRERCGLENDAWLATRKPISKQSVSPELNRVTIVMQEREVLEVYHADLPVGRIPPRRLVSVHGPGAGRCQAEPSKRIHLDLLIRFYLLNKFNASSARPAV